MSRVLCKLVTAGLFVLVIAQSAEGQKGGSPSGTITIGATNPVQKDTVRVDTTWKDCGNASKAEIKLYKGTVQNKANAIDVDTRSASPAGAKGSLGADMSDPTKYKTGDTVFAVLKVYDGTTVIVEKTTGDFVVP